MTWLVWRLSRAHLLVAAIAVGGLAILAALTGPHLATLYQENVAKCRTGDGCAAAAAWLAGQDGPLRVWLGIGVVVIPALIGMFWGAPMVAGELEEGTFRLAWTQSVSRTRWLVARLAGAGLAGVTVAGLVSLVVTWWASPLDRAGMNQFGTFDQRGVVAVGYAAFGFALGAAAGALIRRTLPAMLSTLVVFVAARLAFDALVRPGLMTPVTESLALDPGSTGYGSAGFLPLASAPNLMPNPPDIPNGWVTSIGIVDGHGSALTSGELNRICPGIGTGHPGGGPGGAGLGTGLGSGGSHVQVPQSAVLGMQHCVARVGLTFHEVVTYQPAGRYWPLQWYELAIYLAAAAALTAACVCLVRRIG